MSSFNALDSSDRKGCRPRTFEPLAVGGETAEAVDQEWRPLFDEMESNGPGDSDESSMLEGGDGPERQGESDVPKGGDSDSGGDSTRTFEAGYELGRQEARADVARVAEALVQSVEELAAFRVRLRERYERELLELALAVARKILHAEVKKKPEIWLRLIREAISNAVDHAEVRIRVPTALAAFLIDHLPEMRARLDDVKELVIVEDPALPEGGCVIESQFGELDLGIDSQINHVQRQLTGKG